MYKIEEEPIETVNVYIVPEQEDVVPEYIEHSNIFRMLSMLLCVLFLATFSVIPASSDIGPKTRLVPLQFLPLQTFSATVTIQPTGENVIPATNARGMLTIYNGSILVQKLPKGSIVESATGAVISTDESVIIPGADLPIPGQARVQAHVMVAGADGNIPPLSVHTAYSASTTIKNLSAFSGGNDAYSVPFATGDDKLTAKEVARKELQAKEKAYPAILDRPCEEASTEEGLSLTMSWRCQFVTYEVPAGMHVLSVQRQGDFVQITGTR